MSNFLLGLVGAAVGSAFGMPALGFTVGAGLGSALGHHHGSAPPTAGPRLSDLKVQTSIYGVAIPRLYGTYRISGNMIWASELIERSDPNKTQYHYYANFALGLCGGPIAGFRRVWADGKLLLQPPQDAPPDALCMDYPQWLRFYPGDETQTADPLLEKYQGLGKVPGFRGLAYVVFEDFPLANFNNRLPNLTVEVVQTAAEVIRPEQILPVQPPFPLPLAADERVVDGRRIRTRTGKINNVRYRTQLVVNPPSAPEKNPRVAQLVPLAQIVMSVCQQAGLTADSLDTTGLSAFVRGFVLAGPTSARDALALLQRAYGFDVIESGDKLRCLPRGNPTPLAIPLEAVGAQEDGQVAQAGIVTTRTQSLDLPQNVTVLFTDPTADYAIATQTAQRIHTLATRAERVELPLALNPTEALSIAENLLQEAWEARSQFAFALSRQFVFLEPCDVIRINNCTLRITRIDYGSPGLLKVQAVLNRQ